MYVPVKEVKRLALCVSTSVGHGLTRLKVKSCATVEEPPPVEALTSSVYWPGAYVNVSVNLKVQVVPLNVA